MTPELGRAEGSQTRLLKPSDLLGVPHIQLNDYIKRLALYQSRRKRLHDVLVPEAPEFVLDHSSVLNKVLGQVNGRKVTKRHDSPVFDGMHSPVNEYEQQPGQRMVSVNDSSSISSEQWPRAEPTPPADDVEGENGQVAVDIQHATFHALLYTACIMGKQGGDALRKSERGDPRSVKTYGWVQVSSQVVLNPIMAAEYYHAYHDVKDRLWQGQNPDVAIVYLGMNPRDEQYTLRQCYRTFEDPLCAREIPFSSDPNQALMRSVWTCGMPSTWAEEDKERHDSKDCFCRDKTKSVLVCSCVPGEEVGVLPLRIETYWWKPESITDVEEFSKLARGLAQL